MDMMTSCPIFALSIIGSRVAVIQSRLNNVTKRCHILADRAFDARYSADFVERFLRKQDKRENEEEEEDDDDEEEEIDIGEEVVIEGRVVDVVVVVVVVVFEEEEEEEEEESYALIIRSISSSDCKNTT